MRGFLTISYDVSRFFHLDKWCPSHLSRYIKESIFIRVNNPTLNNNVGKFNLPHIWDRVLINTPGLKLNK